MRTNILLHPTTKYKYSQKVWKQDSLTLKSFSSFHGKYFEWREQENPKVTFQKEFSFMWNFYFSVKSFSARLFSRKFQSSLHCTFVARGDCGKFKITFSRTHIKTGCCSHGATDPPSASFHDATTLTSQNGRGWRDLQGSTNSNPPCKSRLT